MSDNKTFGELVQQLRLEAGITQEELAAFCGVTASYISKIEHDALNSPPSLELIGKMADLLSVDATRMAVYAGQINWDKLKQLARDNPGLARKLQNMIVDYSYLVFVIPGEKEDQSE